MIKKNNRKIWLKELLNLSDPRSGESEEEFINRCMSEIKEFPPDQSYNICKKIYKEGI